MIKRDKNIKLNKYKYEIFDYMIFIGPAFLIFTFLFIVPLFQGVYYSFTNWDAINPKMEFVGLKNYVKIFVSDKYFFPALGRTFYFAIINVILSNSVAMIFSLALISDSKIFRFYRSAIFIPNVLSMVISGFIWRFMFSIILPETGRKIHIFSFLDKSWLGDEKLVIISIVIVSLWQGIGYLMTIYIASLKGMDISLVEAATIDGAGSWRNFWNIKLPYILPTVSVGVFMNISGSLRIFDIVFSLTNGGPGRSSEVAMLEIYREAYQYRNFGYASAKAIILATIIIVITIIQQKITTSREV